MLGSIFLLVILASILPRSYGQCGVVPRSDWGARAPRSITILDSPVNAVILHHSDGPACSSYSSCSATLKSIQSYHMDTNGWSDIDYNFVIGEDGTIYEGRGFTAMETAPYNSQSIGVCLLGNLQTARPTSAQLAAVENLISCAVANGHVSSRYTLKGHTDNVESLLVNVDAPQSLRDHTHEFDVPEVVKVTDGIYMAIGFALANSILVEAPEGAIIIDTTESIKAGLQVLAAFRNWTSSPIKAIILTHFHGDHTGGTAAFIDENNPPEIWAHHLMPSQTEDTSFTGGQRYLGSSRQLGIFLPENALINAGIGLKLNLGTIGFAPPTKLLFDDSQDVKIAGLNLTLIHIPGETSDQMGVWYPEKKAFFCGDDLYRSFPNLYAIRGAPTRNVLEWAESIDKVRKLKPNLLVPSHTRHVEGEDKIEGLLRDYRDAIQFVHDQSIRYMNKGYFPQDAVPLIKLPEALASNPWLTEFYGTVEWSVFSVYTQYVGWFTGNIVDLKSMPTKERARKMMLLGGGARRICNIARSTLEQAEDAQWALELATHVLSVNPDNIACKEVRFSALRNLASKHTSANGRNYYLAVAMEDYNLVNPMGINTGRTRYLNASNALEVLQIMRGMVMAEIATSTLSIAVFNFTDVQEIFTLNLRHGLMEVVSQVSAQYDFMVTVALSDWKNVISGLVQLKTLYDAGDIYITGGVSALQSFMKNFESFLY